MMAGRRHFEQFNGCLWAFYGLVQDFLIFWKAGQCSVLNGEDSVQANECS